MSPQGYEALVAHVDEPSSKARSVPHGGTFTTHPNGKYSFAYGPAGLQGLLHNRYTLGCTIFASIGGLLFGYDQGVIANVLVMKDFKERWPVSPWQVGWMTAILELGALLGALGAGFSADKYSRRHSILIACIVFCVGSMFQCGATSLLHIFIGRAIGGIGIGALSMLSPLYMAEISPPELRGSLVALEQLAIVLGVVFGFWAGFSTRSFPDSSSWRLPLALQIIPGLLLGAGCLVLPASPRFLVLRGRYEEALRSLARLRMRDRSEESTDPLLQVEFLEMKVETAVLTRSNVEDAEGRGPISTELRTWITLFGPEYSDRTMIGILMMFFQQWSGINALLYYGPSLMHSLGLQGDTVELLGTGGIGIVQLLAVFPAILYIDRLGRKPLLIVGGALMGLAHLSIAILVWLYQSSWPTHPWAAWSAVGFVYIFTAVYGVSYGPVAWILPGEVFPISMRSRGVALSTSSNWINNFFVGLMTPLFISFSPTLTFFTFSVACFVASLWSKKYVPETANRSLEEIDTLFTSPVAARDAEWREEIAREMGLEGLVQELSE